jgi:GDP/UDP-N,N'-diacetylbacillosamine 2-epimerase (hydrolysing)
MVRVGVLTSSRADFGVYLPLLKELQADPDFKVEIIAFGTHLSIAHGATINEIEKSGFSVKYKVVSMVAHDSEEAVATSVGLTFIKFSALWEIVKNEFDVVLCLGDRYEMFSAVLSAVPYGIKFAHFYGGDRSDGAIDNVYRDCMTIASQIHFTSTQKCAERVKALTSSKNVHPVGILSLEPIKKMPLLSILDFHSKWKVDLSKPTALVTFHPETVNSEVNYSHAKVVEEVIEEILKTFQVVVTMPNADTHGSVYRKSYEALAVRHKKFFAFENLGMESYFTCMKHCKFVLGNTSSGISEAPTFQKYFINIGIRQQGREMGANVISTPFQSKHILEAIWSLPKDFVFKGNNIYHMPGSVTLVRNILKHII